MSWTLLDLGRRGTHNLAWLGRSKNYILRRIWLVLLPVLWHNQSIQNKQIQLKKKQKKQLKVSTFYSFNFMQLHNQIEKRAINGNLEFVQKWIHLLISFFLILVASSWHYSWKIIGEFWISFKAEEHKSKFKGLKTPPYDSAKSKGHKDNGIWFGPPWAWSLTSSGTLELADVPSLLMFRQHLDNDLNNKIYYIYNTIYYI